MLYDPFPLQLVLYEIPVSPSVQLGIEQFAGATTVITCEVHDEFVAFPVIVKFVNDETVIIPLTVVPLDEVWLTVPVLTLNVPLLIV